MSVPRTIERLTEAQYLENERSAEQRSEFFAGEMFAMAGGNARHSLIASNFLRELGVALKGRPCVPYNSGLRVKVEATGLFTYPDLSVICGPLQFVDSAEDTVLNPTVLVEVLSDSTEAYDRGKKFEHYRRIGSLRDYLLVSQVEPRIEAFSKTETGLGQLREAIGLGATLEIPALRVAISLAEIYSNVKFPGSGRSVP